MADHPYSNGIGVQIQCREDFDTLLEMEQMGGKIRDTEDEFVGAEGRDDETKFMISPRYGSSDSYFPDPHMGEPGFNPPEKRNNVVIRVWGSTFKPILKKECLRLGVQVFDRVMGTSLLNENGVQGARVVGATGPEQPYRRISDFPREVRYSRGLRRRLHVADEHGTRRLLQHAFAQHKRRRHGYGVESRRHAYHDGKKRRHRHRHRAEA